jgi:glycerol uptake facilitator-like aquaporin
MTARVVAAWHDLQTLARRAVAELIGTAILLAAIVGSGIMGERLAGGNVAIALLANSIATGGVLVCLILALGPISGAHFNPAVSISDTLRRGLSVPECAIYVAAQVLGGIVGVLAAHAMFGLPPLFLSHHSRTGPSQWFAEAVATFGLLLVIWGCVRFKSPFTAFAVGGYIVGAYWFTASTSFANPAVTIARSLTDTFAGIRPLDVPGFIAAQFVGALGATALFNWLAPINVEQAEALLLPHDGETRVA